MGNVNPIKAAVEKFKNVTEGVLARFKDYTPDTIAAIVNDDAQILNDEDFGNLVFDYDSLQAMYPGAHIIGACGKASASAPITSMTRIGNAGNYLNVMTKDGGSYIQLTFLPGETSEVSATNHNVRTGAVETVKIDDEEVSIVFPSKIVNLKIFSTAFDEDQLGNIETLFQNFMALQTGKKRMKKTVGGKEKSQPIYRGTNLVVFFQGDYEKTNGDTLEINVTAIAIVDTRPKAVKQLGGWSPEPVKLSKRNVIATFANEHQLIEAMEAMADSNTPIADSMSTPVDDATPPTITF